MDAVTDELGKVEIMWEAPPKSKNDLSLITTEKLTISPDPSFFFPI